MYKTIAGAVAGLLVGVLVVSVNPKPAQVRDLSPRKLAYTDAAAAMDYFVEKRAPVGQNEVPSHRYREALAQRDRMGKARIDGASAKVGTPIWRQVGPNFVGGRTRAIWFDTGDSRTMYAGAASGGVWKSTNAGDSWSLPSDDMANLAVTSIVQEPNSGRLYVGTGEGFYVNRPVSRSRGVRGDGIFVSDDGGLSWLQLPATAGKSDFDYVNRLLMLPDGRLLAATRTGVWASDNRGQTFARVLQVPIVEGCSDFAYSAATARIMVSCGMHSPGGIWMSGNRGETWAKVYGDNGVGRTGLAVAPSNTSVVYGLSADPIDYGVRRVIRSSDGGATWTTRYERTTAATNGNLLLSNYFNLSQDCRTLSSIAGGGWYHNAIAVHPLNENVIYTGGVDLYRSGDGGVNFAPISRWSLDENASAYAHADQHVIAFEPGYDEVDKTTLFVGNDGGVQSTDNAMGFGGTSACTEEGIEVVWRNRNNGYYVMQFYHGSVADDLSLIAGGMQDNGTMAGPNDDSQRWRDIYGGDGAYTLVDPRSSNILYYASQWANLQRSQDGGVTTVSIANGINANSADYQFITPMTIDRVNPDTIYTGGRLVYRSTNRGNNWRAISNTSLDPNRGQVSAIEVSEFNNLRVAVGFDSGTVAITDNANANTPTWRVIQPRAGFVASITIDPTNQNRIFVIYSNFGGNKVFRSTDGGQSFVAIDGTDAVTKLPDVPAHSLLIDPRDGSSYLLGTDIGLFVGLNNGASWHADASGLGNVLIERLQAVSTPTGHELFAFTYGRGIFRTSLSALPLPKVNPGWSGLWVEQGVDGQGMQLLALPETDQMLMSWYTFLPDGARATRTKNLWLLGLGSISNGVVTFNVSAAADGLFDAGNPSAQVPVGTVTLAMNNCASAQASYSLTIDGAAATGQIPLTRLSPDTVCDLFRTSGEGAFSILPRPSAPDAFQYGHTGAWHDESKPGQGLILEAMPNQNQLIATWFTYDFAEMLGNGRQSPMWLAAIGPMTGNTATLNVILTTGGRIDQAGGITNTPVGTLRLTSTSCTAMEATYELEVAGQRRTGVIPLSRITAGTLCR